jgi:selenocysteine lyase/cysteine desulfurase
VTRVPTEPFASFGDRFLEAAADPRAGYDWVFVSQVFFDSGLVFERFAELAEAIPDPATILVVDGYHGFMARPTDLGPVERRLFYLAGGYKYAMAGEGACFMHCPPGYGPRPVDTGWFAGFGELEGEDGAGTEVSYAADATRFLGSTFDPTGLYRLDAALGRWRQLGVTVADLHRHVTALQRRFLAAVEAGRAGPLRLAELIPPPELAERGHFLTFRRPDAADLQRRLAERHVVTDVRADRLRFGFAPYHDEGDVDALIDRLATVD